MDVSPPPPSRLTPRSYTPVNGELHPVSATDSWITLAARSGMTPWQLIRYNYPKLPEADLQLAAKEVNWYLKNYVGCTRSDDGRNYAFSAGLKVWIPRRAAPTPAPVPLTPDEAAKAKVLAILGDPVMHRMNFLMGQYLMITYGDYVAVAKAITDGKITVKANPRMGSSALYHWQSNEIEFNPDTASPGLIVHECTHALFDVRKQSLILAQNEGSAYVAQSLYELLKTGTIQRNIVSWEGHPDILSPISWQGIFDEAARLAQMAQRNAFLPEDEIEHLFNWINGADSADHSFYRGRGKEVRNYDGV